jgi:hypothetical protein
MQNGGRTIWKPDKFVRFSNAIWKLVHLTTGQKDHSKIGLVRILDVDCPRLARYLDPHCISSSFWQIKESKKEEIQKKEEEEEKEDEAEAAYDELKSYKDILNLLKPGIYNNPYKDLYII